MPESNKKKLTIKDRLFGASANLKQKDADLEASQAEVTRLTDLCAKHGIEISQKEPSSADASKSEAQSAEGATPPAAAAEEPTAEPVAAEPTAEPAAAAPAEPKADDALATAQADVTRLTSELTTANADLSAAQAKIKQLEAEAKSAETRAVEILAEAGHDAADLMPASSEAKSTEGLVGRDRLDAAAAEAHPELFKKN